MTSMTSRDTTGPGALRRRTLLGLLELLVAGATLGCAPAARVAQTPPEPETPVAGAPGAQGVLSPDAAGAGDPPPAPPPPPEPPGPAEGTVVCDGRTAQAIEDCLRRAGAGGDVYLPEGTYTIDHPIAVPWDGLTLRGAGGATVLQAKDNTFNVLHLPERQGVALRFLHLRGTGQDGRGGAGVTAYRSHGCRFERLWLERCGSSDAAGLQLEDSADNVIAACRFEENGRGVHLYGASTGNTIEDCSGTGNAKELLFLNTGSADCVVRRCVSEHDGARAPAVAIAVHQSDRTALLDCTVHRAGREQGVEIAAGDDNVVAGCTIGESNWAGLHLINTRRTRVSGNTITANRQSGILIRSGGGPAEARPCEDCLIEDNLIAGNVADAGRRPEDTWAGIELQQGVGVRIERNRFLDNRAAAIYIAPGNAGTRIAGNAIQGAHEAPLVDRGIATDSDVTG